MNWSLRAGTGFELDNEVKTSLAHGVPGTRRVFGLPPRKHVLEFLLPRAGPSFQSVFHCISKYYMRLDPLEHISITPLDSVNQEPSQGLQCSAVLGIFEHAPNLLPTSVLLM